MNAHSLWRLGDASLVVTDALVLQLVDQALHLVSLQAFGVEIVGFGHVKVGNNVLVCFILKHILVKNDAVEVLVILFVLEMVHDCELGRFVLQQNLNGDRWHEAATH